MLEWENQYSIWHNSTSADMRQCGLYLSKAPWQQIICAQGFRECSVYASLFSLYFLLVLWGVNITLIFVVISLISLQIPHCWQPVKKRIHHRKTWNAKSQQQHLANKRKRETGEGDTQSKLYISQNIRLKCNGKWDDAKFDVKKSTTLEKYRIQMQKNLKKTGKLDKIFKTAVSCSSGKTVKGHIAIINCSQGPTPNAWIFKWWDIIWRRFSCQSQILYIPLSCKYS